MWDTLPNIFLTLLHNWTVCLLWIGLKVVFNSMPRTSNERSETVYFYSIRNIDIHLIKKLSTYESINLWTKCSQRITQVSKGQETDQNGYIMSSFRDILNWYALYNHFWSSVKYYLKNLISKNIMSTSLKQFLKRPDTIFFTEIWQFEIRTSPNSKKPTLRTASVFT